MARSTKSGLEVGGKEGGVLGHNEPQYPTPTYTNSQMTRLEGEEPFNDCATGGAAVDMH